MKKVIIVPQHNSIMATCGFNDAKNKDDIVVLDGPVYFRNKFTKLAYKVHNSHKFNLPFKSFWHKKKMSSLWRIKFQENVCYSIVILDRALALIDKEMLFELKKNHHIKLILCLVNPINSSSGSLALSRISEFDSIFSFDKQDSVKYSLNHFFQIYSKIECDFNGEVEHDIYFVGVDKGRAKLIYECEDKFKEYDVKYNLTLVYSKKKREFSLANYKSSYIPYSEIIVEIQKSNCILEILQEGQAGTSFRYVEAICYNKKLLTDNPNIVNFPYYNPKFMKIFKCVDDIDYDWIKRKEEIDYSYKGDFSPLRFIEMVKSLR